MPPFQSESQRRYMFVHHPEIAKRWAHEYPNQKNLPMHKKENALVKAKKHKKK